MEEVVIPKEVEIKEEAVEVAEEAVAGVDGEVTFI